MIIAIGQMISKRRRRKTLVISGDFYSQKAKQNGIIPMAGLVTKKIVGMGIKYAGGEFYNFGVKELTDKFPEFDNDNLPFGSITENENGLLSNKWWFHVGRAKSVEI